MKTQTLKIDQILTNEFTGNMKHLYDYIKEYEHLLPELYIDMTDQLRTLSKFQSFIRNMMSKNIINNATKLGRSLLFTNYNVCQLLLSRKYIQSGVAVLALDNYLIDMSIGDIRNRLKLIQLPNIIDIVTKYNQKNTISNIESLNTDQPIEGQIKELIKLIKQDDLSQSDIIGNLSNILTKRKQYMKYI